MPIEPNDIRITQYIFDELTVDERTAFEMEMREDAELQNLVEETQATIASLTSSLDDESSVALTQEQRGKLEQAISHADASPSSLSRSKKLISVIAVAASLMLIVSAVIFFKRPQQIARVGSDRDANNAISSEINDTHGVSAIEEKDGELALSKQDLGSLRGPMGNPEPTINTVFDTRATATKPKGMTEFERRNAAPTSFSFHPGLQQKNVEGGGLLRGDDGPDYPGKGPGQAGDRYDRIYENAFLKAKDNPLSTFSIDVDTAAYSKVRMYLKSGQSPRPDAVRIEELVNYFLYSYEPPTDDKPFAARIEITQCPWAPKHRLARIGIKGKEIENQKRPASNLVFLLDVSGSMRSPNKLPLLKRGMKMLVDQLGENDRVAIVVYASASGLVLDSTTADEKETIMSSLERLNAGGSTNGGAGIQLAYQVAMDHYIEGGVNRVILCTDGDFNVGDTGTDTLTRMVEKKAKSGVFLTVLGFGMGNHNDAMMEQISNKGNGNYAFIDNDREAQKVLVEQISGTLVTIAKDVKIQVEFNPEEVAGYRLIGYENRILAAEDFNDDKKDAGEIGAGHTVTALYEIVPTGVDSAALRSVDDLKYQKPLKTSKASGNGEMLTLKLRYKQPDGDTSRLLEFPVKDAGKRFGDSDQDFRFAAAVAQFGMLLRDSKHKGDSSLAAVLEIATEAAKGDASGYRREFLELVRIAEELKGE